MNYSAQEMMTIAAAREIRNCERVLVGVGQPNIAANLARRTHARDAQLIYEAGVIDSRPTRLPLSIGDPCLVSGAMSICSFFDLFALYLQGGLVDVGVLGAAQVDRYGNLNTTVIGSYEHPRARLGGSGGACDIASMAGRLIYLVPHELRRFPERCDFVTSPGHLTGGNARYEMGLPGKGPDVVVTDLAVCRFYEDGEMTLAALFPGASVEQVLRSTGWPLRISSQLSEVSAPTPSELNELRTLMSETNAIL